MTRINDRSTWKTCTCNPMTEHPCRDDATLTTELAEAREPSQQPDGVGVRKSAEEIATETVAKLRRRDPSVDAWVQLERDIAQALRTVEAETRSEYWQHREYPGDCTHGDADGRCRNLDHWLEVEPLDSAMLDILSALRASGQARA